MLCDLSSHMYSDEQSGDFPMFSEVDLPGPSQLPGGVKEANPWADPGAADSDFSNLFPSDLVDYSLPSSAQAHSAEHSSFNYHPGAASPSCSGPPRAVFRVASPDSIQGAAGGVGSPWSASSNAQPYPGQPSGMDAERRLQDLLSESTGPGNALPTSTNAGAPEMEMCSEPSLHTPTNASDGSPAVRHHRSHSAGPQPSAQMYASDDDTQGGTSSHGSHSSSESTRLLALPTHCPPALHRSSWNIQQFALEKVLYVGNISRVLRAVDRRTGMPVALKVYKRKDLSDMEKYQVAREIRMHSELYHHNIIRLYCAWKDSQYIYVAVEWAPNGDIYSMLKRFGNDGVSEPVVVAKIFRPLLSALAFIHAKGLIHRDLKPENILLGANYEIKLSDFGLSINQYDEVANTRLGTLNYIAPEILQCPYKRHPLENKEMGSVGYNNKVDIWSLGVLAYELLTAQLPFSGTSMADTLQKIMMNHVVFPPSVSPLARQFMMICLQSNPASRPTVEELCRHPWGIVSGSQQRSQPQFGLTRELVEHTGSVVYLAGGAATLV